MYELFVEAKIENIDKVLDFVSKHIEECSVKIQNQISIAIDEIFSNIARYAYHPEVGLVIVRIAVDEDITIEFEDSGIEYDPLATKDPDLSLSLEEREIGGLGIFILKKLMDTVEYNRIGDKNVLLIRKKSR